MCSNKRRWIRYIYVYSDHTFVWVCYLEIVMSLCVSSCCHMNNWGLSGIHQADVHSWCILHCVVCSVLKDFKNKPLNMIFFWEHNTAPSPFLPPPSHWCSGAIFTCKYPGRWVGSCCGQLGNTNYICMWFEWNTLLSESCSAGTSQQRDWLHSSVPLFKILIVCPYSYCHCLMVWTYSVTRQSPVHKVYLRGN